MIRLALSFYYNLSVFSKSFVAYAYIDTNSLTYIVPERKVL